MTFAPRSNLISVKMSTWTPLNHQVSNNNVFEERRNLLRKWFDKWSDGQRKAVLQDFFSRCSAVQLRFLRQSLTQQVPEEAADFTAALPRVLSLYVLSFLDPRSLCRCAQVSWHWRAIVELDQLWMPKCLRLGWCINFAPTPFEQGVWKRHYIEMVRTLHTGRPNTPSHQQFVVPEVTAVGRVEAEPPEGFPREVRSAPPLQRARGSTGRSLGSGQGTHQPTGLPPWRGSDRHPKDTRRFNYLENLEPVEPSRQPQTKSCPSKTVQDDATKKKPLSAASYKLRKAKSLMFLSLDQSSNTTHQPHQHQARTRPSWATRSLDYPVTKETAKSLSRSAQWNAGIRPGPARRAVPKLSQDGLRACQRTQRSTPTTPLFEGQPWKIAVSSQGSDQE